MEKQITFESAHAAALELKPAVGGLAVYLKFIAKMSRGAAKAMDAEYAVYGTDSLPKPGWTKMDSDFMARNVGLTFDVKSIGKGPKAFHLELNCPLVDKFVFVRIGGKKKGKGTYVACKARALVDGRYQEAAVDPTGIWWSRGLGLGIGYPDGQMAVYDRAGRRHRDHPAGGGWCGRICGRRKVRAEGLCAC